MRCFKRTGEKREKEGEKKRGRREEEEERNERASDRETEIGKGGSEWSP